MRGAPVLSTFGWALGAMSVALVMAALVAAANSERDAVLALAGSSLVTTFVSIALIFGFRDRVVGLRRRHGLALVALVWLVVPAFASLPFNALVPGEGFLAAYFDAVSAFTTTGTRLSASADALPRGLVFWTALLQWGGGATTIIFAATALDRAGRESGEGLLVLSSTLADQTRLMAAAREILPLYTLLTSLCFFGLLAAGVPRFDAACLALAAISTGGAMPNDGGLVQYGGAAPALVMAAAMLVGSLSFFVVKGLLTRRGLPRFAVSEVLVVLGVIGAAAIMVAWFAASSTTAPFQDNLAGAIFSVVALTTTTGIPYDTAMAMAIPLPAVFLFIMIGGMYGSTAGGLKVGRVLHMLRDAGGELARLVHPSAVTAFAERRGKAESGRVVWTYFVAYLTAFAIIATITAAYGVDFEHALLWAASMLSNAGPALGFMPVAEMDPIALIAGGDADGLLLASVATMVLGRIEVLALLAILTPLFWKK